MAMEAKDLPNFIVLLGLIGILVGVVLTVLGNLENSTKQVVTVVNESITITSQAGQTDNSNVTAFSMLVNATDPGQVWTSPDVNVTANGAVSTGANVSNGAFGIWYTANQSTAATTGLKNSVLAINEIPTTWLGLIITISVLALILMIVLRSFGVRGR